jgi:type VI secretion system protein ImpG
MELAVTFNRRLESFPLVSRENVRLHCVPVINLFEHAADPIRVQHDRTEYLIQPSRSGVADRRHLEVYSVDEVAGLVHAESLESRVYQPFYSFRHMETADPLSARYYQTHLRPNVTGGDIQLGTDTYISFVAGGRAGQLPPEETISLELTCTNRDLPLGLRAGDICDPTDTSPAGTAFRNLLKPTPTISPPMGKALHWRLISHMSLNYVSLTDAEHFKELLRVYDFQSEHDAQVALAHQRMLDGVLDVRSRFGERMMRGTSVRGSQIEVELDEDRFAGEGDAYLFGTILDRFFGLYATLNAYTQLTVRFSRSGQVYDFAPRWGEQMTPAASR